MSCAPYLRFLTQLWPVAAVTLTSYTAECGLAAAHRGMRSEVCACQSPTVTSFCCHI